MKIVFVGPSLPSSALDEFRPRIEFREPARFGDVAQVVREGARTIGLIDGYFGDCAAVWHKEILFALSRGARVFGAASMGALRAAECSEFGMIGIGDVYRRYAAGLIVDDDAVAQLHGPAELDFVALSEPLVNIDATCRALLTARLISESESVSIAEAARKLFFKDRDRVAAIRRIPISDEGRRSVLLRLFEENYVDIKKQDAIELVSAVDAIETDAPLVSQNWTFTESSMWKTMFDEQNK